MMIILTLNAIISYFCIDNFKYVSLVIGFSDGFSSFIYSMTCTCYILSNFFLAKIWENYSFMTCVFFYFLTQTIPLILVLLS